MGPLRNSDSALSDREQRDPGYGLDSWEIKQKCRYWGGEEEKVVIPEKGTELKPTMKNTHEKLPLPGGSLLRSVNRGKKKKKKTNSSMLNTNVISCRIFTTIVYSH